ncbi:Hypothetical predicted protein [Olea europaea subsp. europaea]|uniref:LAZY1 n=1 Tax=Olea europaea subsp. europaea TaxID=158383 RepID=A0A8S0V7Y2_OLEEU|nr:Hypothetical predicted protein [Olea europaea subsp. europaea]
MFRQGNPSSCPSVQAFSDDRHYLNPIKTFSHSNTKCQKSSHKIEAENSEVTFHEDAFDPFGFLAIGTFGMELLNTDPPTPRFIVPDMNVTNEETEITNNDLKLINYELEKFLEAEAKEIANDSSERSSQASIITLSNKQIEGGDSEGTNTVPCPLQNYLFGSLTELAGTGVEAKKERTSLGELFKRNLLHDDPSRKYEESEKEARGRYVKRFMKKMVKNSHSATSSSTLSSKGDAAESISIKRKLSKALKVFCTKVYPEEMTAKQFINLQKGKNKNIFHEGGHKIGGGNDNKKLAQVANIKNEKNTAKLFSNGVGKSASAVNRERWIKTDTDFLVLEL